MFITVPAKVDIEDIASDVSTALSVCRTIYGEYFTDVPTDKEGKAFATYFYSERENVGKLIGTVVDYIRSAELLLNAYEKQQATE